MFKNYNYESKSGKHSFDIDNIDLSIANSIRRIILTEIPVVGFYGEDEPSIDIIANTGPLHNEFMKHRIGLIPINVSEEITDTYIDNDYKFELNVINDTSSTINITTADFTGTYKDVELTVNELKILFPSNPITKNNILITRLRAGEELNLIARAVKKTAKANASFSAVSLSNFYFIEDKKESDKQDNILDKHRSYVKNIYGDPTLLKFEIETVNNLSYLYLFSTAIIILINKLKLLITNIEANEIMIEPIPNNPFSVNFHIENEDDSLGNVIQSLLHNKYIRQTNKHKGINCSYVGYICPHPLKQLMIVRLTLDEQTDTEKFKQFLIDNCYDIIRELESINTEWIKFNEKQKGK
jgi:DNA-directed RNA polymerase subunit L